MGGLKWTISSEENYNVTRYIAEFMNTISNLVFSKFEVLIGLRFHNAFYWWLMVNVVELTI